MAVKLETVIKRYIGLSTDTKPVPDRDDLEKRDNVLPPGSSFLESDTGNIYRWNGFEWLYESSEDVLQEANTDYLRLILFELQQLRQLVQLVTS